MVAGAALCCAASCAGTGLLTSPSLHERYAAMLRQSGLGATALGTDWLRASEVALQQAAPVSLPFRESGYFPPGEPGAIAYRLELQRGRRLAIDVALEGSEPGTLFVDLFEVRDQQLRRVASLAADQRELLHEVERDGTFIVRVQPELLRGGRFTLVQRTLATLRFPVEGLADNQVRSMFGAVRDAGTREHEGIDIFAPRGTPVVAVVGGTARPDTNGLGGNVVWLRGQWGRSYYYAHLDRWAIDRPTSVRPGDVLGYVGNTGNARGTAPHLHFGIYEGGAIDPLPFVRADDALPSEAPLERGPLDRAVRVSGVRTPLYAGPSITHAVRATLSRHSVARTRGASGTWLRVVLPDSSIGYVQAAGVTPADKPLRTVRVNAPLPLLDAPAPAAATITVIEPGQQVQLLGSFDGFDLVRDATGRTGWSRLTATTS